MFKKQKESDGLFKSVILAYTILALHVLLIAGLALLVLFFRGIVNYMLWIFLGGTAILVISAFCFYRRMKAKGRTLSEALRSSMFQDREVEVSVLGGLATLKIGRPDFPPALEAGSSHSVPQLEDPESVRIRELKELAHLLESNLITQEEYNQAKKKLFKA
ncbi:MAG: SHOCT domain-containing protein [Desulfobacteraceae bacterium]|jgi:hypothetical protein